MVKAISKKQTSFNQFKLVDLRSIPRNLFLVTPSHFICEEYFVVFVKFESLLMFKENCLVYSREAQIMLIAATCKLENTCPTHSTGFCFSSLFHHKPCHGSLSFSYSAFRIE